MLVNHHLDVHLPHGAANSRARDERMAGRAALAALRRAGIATSSRSEAVSAPSSSARFQTPRRVVFQHPRLFVRFFPRVFQALVTLDARFGNKRERLSHRASDPPSSLRVLHHPQAGPMGSSGCPALCRCLGSWIPRAAAASAATTTATAAWPLARHQKRTHDVFERRAFGNIFLLHTRAVPRVDLASASRTATTSADAVKTFARSASRAPFAWMHQRPIDGVADAASSWQWRRSSPLTLNNASRRGYHESRPRLTSGGSGSWHARASSLSKLNEHPAMIRPRTIRVPILGVSARMSLMEAAGHVSFLLLAASYLTRDLVTLRCIAMGGLSAAMVFQYFRPAPLWLPLSWNLVFVAINAAWVATLLWEEHLAHAQITAEERELRERHFSHMPERDFWHLLHCGEWVDVPSGTRLTTEGESNDRVYAVVEGSARVAVHGQRLHDIHEGEFVGEMSLMKAIHSSGGVARFSRDDRPSLPPQRDAHAPSSSEAKAEPQKTAHPLAEATVTAERPMRCYAFDHDALVRYLDGQPEALAAVTAAFGASLVEKLADVREHSSQTMAIHSAREGMRG